MIWSACWPVEALVAYETTDGANLLTAYKRAANILQSKMTRYDHADGLDDKHLKTLESDCIRS